MSDKPSAAPAEKPVAAAAENAASKAPAAAKALPEQNPAFKAMGMFTLLYTQLRQAHCVLQQCNSKNSDQAFLDSASPRAIG